MFCRKCPVPFLALLMLAMLASVGHARMVVDIWGREVQVPDKVERILALGSAGPRLAAYLGVMPMLAGVERADAQKATVLRDYSPVWHGRIKGLPLVGNGGGSGQNNAYPEEIIKLAPDVIVAGFNREAADELQRQTGIPVVAIRQTTTGFINDSFDRSMRVFAEAVGAQERCEKVLAFVAACKEDLRKRTADIPDAGKKRAYAGGVTYNGRHGLTGTYSQFGPFLAIGARNVADTADINGFYEADAERIVSWDPDIIFIDPGNAELVDDSYKTARAAYDSLKAVRTGEIYTMPAFNHMGTNITYALLDAYWAGKVLFPDRFADVDMARKAAEVFETMLGRDIFHLMEQGGLFFGRTGIAK